MLVPAILNGGTQPLLGPSEPGLTGDILITTASNELSWQSLEQSVQMTLGASLTAQSGIIVNYDDQVRLTELSLAPVVAKTNVAQSFTKQQRFGLQTLTDGANIVWNLDDHQVTQVTLGGNRTINNPTNQHAGATYILIVKQDGTGSRTLTFGTAYLFPGGTAPTLTTAANSIDVLTFISDGTNMLGVAQIDFQ